MHPLRRPSLQKKAKGSSKLLMQQSPPPNCSCRRVLFLPQRSEGGPPRPGENGAPAARKPPKPVPEHKQVRVVVVDSDSASDNDIPELSINLEPHAAEEVAAADAPAHLYWTRCPDAGYNPLFDHDKIGRAHV